MEYNNHYSVVKTKSLSKYVEEKNNLAKVNSKGSGHCLIAVKKR